MDDKMLALKRARLLEARSKESAPKAETVKESTGNPFVKMATDEMGRFGDAMLHGRSIGEHMPGGETIADLGSAIGAGGAALTAMPFSQESFSNLYAKYRQPSIDQTEKEKAYDNASVSADLLKGTLASIPLGAMKGTQAVAAKTAPGWLSSGSKYSVPAEGGGLFPKAPPKGWLSGTSTAGETVPTSATTRADMIKDFLMKKAKEKTLGRFKDMQDFYEILKGPGS